MSRKKKEQTTTQVCVRCNSEYEETQFQVNARVIMDAAKLCPVCKEKWLEVRKERGFGNIHYVGSSDKIDW